MGRTHKAKILHTADWQLGMQRKFLSDEAQSRFDQARLESIQKIFDIAATEECDAIVVAGDVFDDNLLSGTRYGRAIEVLRNAPVPVYLLPGNHDPYDSVSIYRKKEFEALAGSSAAPVTVLCDSTIHTVPGRDEDAGDLQIIGAPLLSKSADRDLIAETLGELKDVSAGDKIRVIVGHGPAQGFGDKNCSVLIDVHQASARCEERVADYVALGDTHSAMKLDNRENESGRVWYSGAPEVTNFKKANGGGESNSGKALVVTIEVDLHAPDKPSTINVEEVEVGTWKFIALEESINNIEDAEKFIAQLDKIPNKPETAVKYGLTGTINLETEAYLESELGALREVFAALYLRDRTSDLQVIADESDLDGAIFGDSFIGVALQDLIEERQLAGLVGDVAGDAVKLLYRLSGAGASVLSRRTMNTQGEK